MTNKTSGAMIGQWSITEMEMWDQEFMDIVEPAYLHITEDGFGEFHFGVVYVSIRGESGNFKIGDIFEFDFEGDDEGDYCSGSGYITILDEHNLDGWFEFRDGDESTFKASRIVNP